MAAADIPPHIGTLPVARQIAVKLETTVWELRPILAAVLNFYRTSVNLELTVAGTAEAISRNLKAHLQV